MGQAPAAIVLAAGQSKRFGTLKQRIKFGERTMVELVLTTVLSFQCSPIILVVGYQSSRVVNSISQEILKKITVKYNPSYESGIASSIKSGISELNRYHANSSFIVLGDQPFLNHETLEKIYRTYMRTGKTIRPTFKQTPVHPVLLSSELMKESLLLKGDVGYNSFLHRFSSSVEYLELTTAPSIIKDVDTFDDYLYLKNLFDQYK